MKIKLQVILLQAFLCCSLCACTKTEESISVYIVQTEALYKTSLDTYIQDYPERKVNVKYFDTYEEMNELLNTELMSGKGPDLLLFNSFYSQVDPYKLATSQSLLALHEQVSELPEDTYFGKILDAGQIQGQQYFLPLSWNVVQAYSGADTVAGKGYGADLYTAISTEAEALSQDENRGASSLSLGRIDVLNYFCEIAGTEIVSMETGDVIMDKEAVLAISDFVKEIYDNLGKMRTISSKYRNDFAGAVAHFTYLLEDYPFMNNLRYYQSLYPGSVGEEMYFAPFAQMNQGKEKNVTAQVIQYGAISANTENAECAWKLLRYLLDAPANMNYSKYEEQNLFYAPVNRQRYEECVNVLGSESGPGPKKKVDPLDEENVTLLKEFLSGIAKAVLPESCVHYEEEGSAYVFQVYQRSRNFGEESYVRKVGVTIEDRGGRNVAVKAALSGVVLGRTKELADMMTVAIVEENVP